MKITAIVACSLVLVGATVRSAAAESCTVPPSGSLTLAESKDSKWRAKWCGNQSLVDALWYGLNLNETGDLWDEGWGYEDVCNDNRFLSRLFNAGFIVREVQKIAQHFPEPNSPNAGHKWWNFVNDKEDDGYEPKCCSDEPGLNATHYCCGWSTDLCIKWGFKIGAAVRSSTLVHEATHEDEGHISDDACPNGGSCDTYYGAYNANTMQVNYLYDAAAAYLIETVNNVKQRKVSVFQDSGKQMCSYIPLLEKSERDLQLAQVKNRLDNNFESGSVFPNYVDAAGVDAAKGTPWECAGCKTSDYTFSPQTFGTGTNKACNEITNKQNVAVNQTLRQACQDFNGKIGSASGASAYGQIKNQLNSATTGKCKSCTLEDTKAYCAAQTATATNVSQLDPYGMLSSCGYWHEEECLASFCEKKFENAWATHADDATWDDPAGCLDAVCGNDAKCRKRFLTYGGDPTYYDPSGCMEGLVECYEDKGKTIPGAAVDPKTGRKLVSIKTSKTIGGISSRPVTVATSDPIGRGMPGEVVECTQEYDLCKAIEAMKKKILGYRMVHKWINPIDPVSRVNPWEITAQEAFRNRVTEMKKGLDRGTLKPEQFEQQFEALMAHDQSKAVAFSLEPQAYVGLFGKGKAQEALVGPSIRSVKPKTLKATDLDARGVKLFKQFETMKRQEPAKIPGKLEMPNLR